MEITPGCNCVSKKKPYTCQASLFCSTLWFHFVLLCSSHLWVSAWMCSCLLCMCLIHSAFHRKRHKCVASAVSMMMMVCVCVQLTTAVHAESYALSPWQRAVCCTPPGAVPSACWPHCQAPQHCSAPLRSLPPPAASPAPPDTSLPPTGVWAQILGHCWINKMTQVCLESECLVLLQLQAPVLGHFLTFWSTFTIKRLMFFHKKKTRHFKLLCQN